MSMFSIRHLSGYYGTIEVINLEPELTAEMNNTI